MVLIFLGTENAGEFEGVEHVLVGEVDVLLHLPGLAFAVGAAVVALGDDLVVGVAEDAVAFLALAGVVEGNAVAHHAGDEFVLQEGLLPDPFLIDVDNLRFLFAQFLFV